MDLSKLSQQDFRQLIQQGSKSTFVQNIKEPAASEQPATATPAPSIVNELQQKRHDGSREDYERSRALVESLLSTTNQVDAEERYQESQKTELGASRKDAMEIMQSKNAETKGAEVRRKSRWDDQPTAGLGAGSDVEAVYQFEDESKLSITKSVMAKNLVDFVIDSKQGVEQDTRSALMQPGRVYYEFDLNIDEKTGKVSQWYSNPRKAVRTVIRSNQDREKWLREHLEYGLLQDSTFLLGLKENQKEKKKKIVSGERKSRPVTQKPAPVPVEMDDDDDDIFGDVGKDYQVTVKIRPDKEDILPNIKQLPSKYQEENPDTEGSSAAPSDLKGLLKEADGLQKQRDTKPSSERSSHLIKQQLDDASYFNDMSMAGVQMEYDTVLSDHHSDSDAQEAEADEAMVSALLQRGRAEVAEVRETSKFVKGKARGQEYDSHGDPGRSRRNQKFGRDMQKVDEIMKRKFGSGAFDSSSKKAKK